LSLDNTKNIYIILKVEDQKAVIEHLVKECHELLSSEYNSQFFGY